MSAHCPGIEYCSKKACLEQERCLPEVLLQKFYDNRALKKAKLKAVIKNIKHNYCIILRCNKKGVCNILGQCILLHPLVVKDKMAAKQLRAKLSMGTVLKILERLMPKLKRIGKRQYYKPESWWRERKK